MKYTQLLCCQVSKSSCQHKKRANKAHIRNLERKKKNRSPRPWCTSSTWAWCTASSSSSPVSSWRSSGSGRNWWPRARRKSSRGSSTKSSSNLYSEHKRDLAMIPGMPRSNERKMKSEVLSLIVIDFANNVQLRVRNANIMCHPMFAFSEQKKVFKAEQRLYWNCVCFLGCLNWLFWQLLQDVPFLLAYKKPINER